MTQSFPLKWPAGKSVTPAMARRRAMFDTTMGKARDFLIKELKMLGATHVVISSNVETYKKGTRDVMYADQTAAKSEPGVAVYYQWDGVAYCMACDKWDSVTDNLQALNKSVNAIRGLERWGTGDMVKAAFAGFKELPGPGVKSCWEVLGINITTDKATIKKAYRILADKFHPDKGGSHELMSELNVAYMDATSICEG